MAALNKIMLIGNLGKDPEVRMAGSAKVVNFSIAVTEKFKSREGNQQEKTEWVNIVLWNKLADIADKYLKKGSPVYIEGKIQTRSWDDQSGSKRYTTEVVGNSLQMLGQKNSNQQEQPTQQAAPPIQDDDLPF